MIRRTSLASVITLVLTLSNGVAQQAEVWAIARGGAYSAGAAVVEMSDGGAIVVGSSMVHKATPTSQTSGFLIRVNAAGERQWERPVGKFVRTVPIGGYLINGELVLIGGADTNGGGGSHDLYFGRFDLDGYAIEERRYTAPGDDNVYVTKRLANGGFIVTGRGMGGGKVWWLSASGELLRTRTFTPSGDIAAIDETSDGGFIAAGQGADNVPYIMRLNSDGDSLWARSYPTGESEHTTAVHQTSDGGFLFGGFTRESGFGPIFIRLTSSGGFVSRRKESFVTMTTMTSMCRDGDGFLVAGSSGPNSESARVVFGRVNDVGEFAWHKTGGGSYAAVSNISRATDGGIFLVGNTSREPLIYAAKWSSENPSAIAWGRSIPSILNLW